MRIGYIITAHTLPELLVRLVRRLDSGDAQFFVHVDARAPRSVMAVIERELGPARNVHLLPRHSCHWASFSLVEAALKGVKAVLEAPERLEYGVLLTGQDYLLRPPGVIERTLAEADGRSFMSHWPSTGRFLERVERWHWHGEVLGRRIRVPNRFLPLTIKRTLPRDLRAYTGSAHWCLSRACLELIGEALVRDREVVDFFRHSAVPDETFFQTILMNSRLAGTIVDDDLRFIDWSEGQPSPRVLTSEDYERLISSQDLFARKFDPRVDSRVLDMIDAALEAQELAGGRAVPAPPAQGSRDEPG